MSFCEHCEGQRFDRARVLRALRATHRRLRGQPEEGRRDAQIVVAAIEAVRALDIPHLEYVEAEVVH